MLLIKEKEAGSFLIVKNIYGSYKKKKIYKITSMLKDKLCTGYMYKYIYKDYSLNSNRSAYMPANNRQKLVNKARLHAMYLVIPLDVYSSVLYTSYIYIIQFCMYKGRWHVRKTRPLCSKKDQNSLLKNSITFST